ncbi:MAG: biopolymer transporter ExbD [Victivallales bacterium]|jgi:biopolymer transport protein ExbD|nr:biopolymer transporter ExbD [Victivallales bacterium]
MNNSASIGTRRYLPKLKPKSGWPELTALIDILFLVLLFLFLYSSFVRVTGIKVNLPRVQPSSFADLERFVVTITRNGDGGRLLYFNDRPIKIEELKQQFNEVHGRSQSATIIILADREVTLEQSAEIMALAEAAELASFLVTIQPGSRPETVFGQ